MARPQLDPTARSQLLKKLEVQLYGKPELNLWRQLADIIKENSEHCGNNDRWMTFRGEIYNCAAPGEKPAPAMNVCTGYARPRMKKYLAKAEKLASEKELVLGYIRRILLATSHAEDLIALTPQSLHRTLRAVDRFFLQGDGMSEEERKLFLEENAQYINNVRSRLTHNLLLA